MVHLGALTYVISNVCKPQNDYPPPQKKRSPGTPIDGFERMGPRQI